MNDKINQNMKKHNLNLSRYACFDNEAKRLVSTQEDFRTPFFRDIDKIIYSLSYVRYIDKTQVFSDSDNDMISRRMTHVQMVSKIARTIGRALNLNEDLIEAASLGHDLGHVPFGHVGESILNKISLRYGEGYFNHNVQSVRTLMNIENCGKGNNITVQVLDAIFCHNGEMLEGEYRPVSKSVNDFLLEYEKSYKDKDILKNVRPMTLEGCVVRISDIVAYIGKDIDDAIRLGIIRKEDIPKDISDVFGNSNSSIVDTIVKDIINNSIGKDYIKISDDIYNALNKLISFNYENIYFKANSKSQIEKYEKMFNELFALYYKQIENKDVTEDIFTLFLNEMDVFYNECSSARKVIDYIAGMTDAFFISQYNKYFE
ncbi:MAG: deoxyguanosinetriphosphate triphosphohydrolase family protein [Bacilli bacterium]